MKNDEYIPLDSISAFVIPEFSQHIDELLDGSNCKLHGGIVLQGGEQFLSRFQNVVPGCLARVPGLHHPAQHAAVSLPGGVYHILALHNQVIPGVFIPVENQLGVLEAGVQAVPILSCSVVIIYEKLVDLNRRKLSLFKF